MYSFNDELELLLAHLNGLTKMYNNDLKNAPCGRLEHQMNNGYDQFLLVTNEDGRRVRKGINRDESLIKTMARKEFANKALNILEPNIAALNRALAEQISFEPEEILKSMTKAYALLPEEYFFDRDRLNILHGLDGATEARIRRHEKWGVQPYKEYWGYPEKKTKLSSRGQYVRSKSELLIIEDLYKYSIPVHYEEELVVNGRIYAPDFKFMDHESKPFYWEHLGMMDDRTYAKKNIAKLDEYYDIGLIPGDNLILSFDRRGDINMGTIEAIITKEVIPRV